MSNSGSERTVYWYYQLDGKQQGPVLIGRLRQRAHSGKLRSDDLVKKGTSGDWAAADSYEELAAIICPPPLEEEETPIPAPVVIDDSPRESFVSTFIERLSNIAGDVRWAIIGRMALFRTAVGYMLLGGVLIFVGRTAIQWGAFDWSPPPDPLVVYQSTWDEFQSLRKSEVDEGKWNQFSIGVEQKLSPILARLTRMAKSSNREAQFLLWAGRDCLPKFLKDAREAPSSAEQQFGEYLENVKQLRQGKVPFNHDKNRWLRPSPAMPTPISDGQFMVTGGVLLTAINIGIVLWLVRSLLLRKSEGNQNALRSH